ESLKRLGGGRWQTRDERFTIEPQSGTWAVVDAEQTDDFGMPLVRGPYPSLTAAKAAIAAARTSQPATSPLADRLGGEARTKPHAAQTPSPKGNAAKTTSGATSGPAPESSPRARPAGRAPTSDEPEEAAWIADLAAADRGRARRLIATLTERGV